jgi:hypothetical protein
LTMSRPRFKTRKTEDPSKDPVSTKNWYREEIDMWAEFLYHV